MVIVEVSQIPSVDQVVDVPMDNPAAVYNVCQEMREICDRENGIGLSAVQVGTPWRLFLVKGDGTCPLVPEGQYGYFANTEYKATSEEQVVSLEGCLSIRSQDGQLRSFQLNRHKQIRLTGFKFIENNLSFEKFEDVLLNVNQQSVVFEHEIDHHRGVLISDIGKEVFVW
tara:strand:+ start:238 stop:747 length:510 start_codon:yes stop_codon:yes gene_type:complete